MEWKEYKLSEVCDNIYSGGTPSSMVAEYWNGTIPWLSSGETGQKYISKTEKTITEEGVKKSSTRLAYKDSTVVASAGQGYTRGQASYLQIDTYVNQSVIVLKPNTRIVDSRFLYFNIDNRYAELRQLSDGTSTRGSLSGKIMKDLPIVLPPLADQKRIADILSSLDAKIENNNKINAKLEEMAQALFKSWFIDFEPFKVGCDGSRPAFGSGNFVESELGMIPEGWKVGKLGDCTKLITKGTTPTSLKKEFKESGIVFVKAESIKEDHSLDFQKVSFIDEETNILLKRSIICPNDILFTIAGTLGRFCLVEREFSVANTNQAVAIIRLNEDYLPAKVFFSYLLGNWHKDYCIRNIQQAVQANLSLKTISCMPILVPDSDTLRKYTCVIEPIISKMKELEIENRTLAQTRDTLLPKLISGEIEL